MLVDGDGLVGVVLVGCRYQSMEGDGVGLKEVQRR